MKAELLPSAYKSELPLGYTELRVTGICVPGSWSLRFESPWVAVAITQCWLIGISVTVEKLDLS